VSVLLTTVVVLFALFCHIMSVIATKWVVLGKLRPGAHAVYSWGFVRWWLVYKLMLSTPLLMTAGFLRETELFVWFYRGLGATVGHNVVLSGNTFGNIMCDFDLIEIGDEAFIDQGSTLAGHDVQRGMLLLGRCRIGKACIVGACCQVMPGTVLADNVELAPLSLANCSQKTNPHELWEGSPATLKATGSARRPAPKTRSLHALQNLGLAVIVVMVLGSILVPFQISHAIKSDTWSYIFLLAFAILPASMAFLVGVLIFKWLLLGRMREGVYKRTAWNSARLWFIDTLMQSAFTNLAIAVILDPSIGVPYLMRACGCKVGRECCLFYPQLRVGMELFTLEDSVFFGGQVMPCSMDWFHEDGIMFAGVILKERVFCANFSLLQPGTVMEENSILGLLSTVAPHTVCAANAAYMGSPADRVGQLKADEEADDGGISQTLLLQQLQRGEEAEYEDTGKAHYLVVVLVSCSMPMLSIGFFGMMTAGVYYGYTETQVVLQVENFFVQMMLLAVTMVFVFLVELLMAVAIKRICCPEFKGRHIAWGYGFLSWMVFMEVLASLSATILSNVQGTPLMAVWLRMLGANVGDGVYFDTVPPVETDCLDLEDNCAILEAPQSLVPHTLDRGMLQFARIRIGKNASVGINACLNLHSHVAEGAAVAPLSVVMKAEHVPAWSYGQGNPLVVSARAPIEYLEPSQLKAAIEASKEGLCSTLQRTCCCCKVVCCCCSGWNTPSTDDDGEQMKLLDGLSPGYGSMMSVPEAPLPLEIATYH